MTGRSYRALGCVLLVPHRRRLHDRDAVAPRPLAFNRLHLESCLWNAVHGRMRNASDDSEDVPLWRFVQMGIRSQPS